MSLIRLARELDETARQTGEMTAQIVAALADLTPSAEKSPQERASALQSIVVAIQAQDRIEQRCRNLADAVRGLVEKDSAIDHPAFDDIWSSLKLDELAIPEMSGIAAVEEHGECELF